MKMIEVNWAFMSNSLRFPVLKAGRVISCTAFEKGEGQWGGRFPAAFLVVTDDADISTVRVSRAEEKEHPTQGRLRMRDLKPVLFGWSDKARTVAQAWAAGKYGILLPSSLKKITLKVFVVPNPAIVFDGCSGNGPVGKPNGAYNMKLFADDCHAVSRVGFDVFGDDEVTVSDMWAQVWVHDDTCDNLTDHGIPKGHPLYGIVKHAPRRIPVKYLTTIAKGGFTTVILYNRYGELLEEPIEISWVSSQESSRYRNFGSMLQAIGHALHASSNYAKSEAHEAYLDYLEALDSSKRR